MGQPMTVQKPKARGFVLNKDTGEPLAGVNVVARGEHEGRTISLGMLTTDDGGYVSFDLTGLVDEAALPRVSLEVVGEPDAIATAFTGGKNGARPVSLTDGSGAVVLHVDPARVQIAASGPFRPAVQAADARDWELSPASFVNRRRLALGEGACTTPVRSALPITQISFVQIVRRATRPGGPEGTLSEIVIDPISTVSDDEASPLYCDIVDYQQTWQDLGESLGTILYSLPLAPCESIKVAVIEAERSDEAARTDAIETSESLHHSLFRDRNITETVKGALGESQGGSSFMIGGGGAYSGGSTTIGQFGATHALGYGTSQSWGSRSLTAKSAQDLHDSTVQTSDFVRSLNSTVIVQGAQAERHHLETRTVTNHNHCHALTVQYYEVLRRLRLETRHVRTRPGLLVPYRGLHFQKSYPTIGETIHDPTKPPKWLDDPNPIDLKLVNRLRPMLEGDLLEPRLAANFEAVRRLLFFEGATLPAAPAQAPSTDYDLRRLSVTVLRGRSGTAPDAVGLVASGVTFQDPSNPAKITSKPVLKDSGFEGDHDEYDATPKEIGPIKLTVGAGFTPKRSRLTEIKVDFGGGGHFSLRGLKVTAHKPNGEEEVLVDESSARNFDGPGSEPFDVVPPKSPPSPEPRNPPTETADSLAARRAQDVALAWELISHVHDHRDVYGPRLVAKKEPMWFADALDHALGFSKSRDRIDSVPVAISGQYIAFAFHADDLGLTLEMADPPPQPTPTIVSLPTRGVLAEAQLGNCNACEKRDVTRFWKWEESPCEQPPAIEGVSPGFRGQAPSVEQGKLPNAVVQITQPPAAPDPVGLAAAITLLGKGDAFRDMSGMKELSGLLNGLTSGAVSLAQARKMAADVKQATAEASGNAAGAGNRKAPAQKPGERLDNLQVAKELAAAASELGLDKARTAALTSDILGGAGGGIASLPGWILQAAMGAIGPTVATSDPSPSVNQDVVLTIMGAPPAATVSWSGGGTPATGAGATFTTRFPTHGSKIVTATWTTADGGTVAASTSLKVNEPSGAAWIARFPDSADPATLVEPFQSNVRAFLSALTTAGAVVSIETTFRPPKRVYLMHWAYEVAKGYNPATVPSEPGVDIGWLHRRADGSPDPAASKAAAADMVSAYKIVHAPSLGSRHQFGRAIDMNVTWTGSLTIVNGHGTTVTLATNAELHTVGATFGVIKLVTDAPHWSDDGH
jgi:hypothetical protein